MAYNFIRLINSIMAHSDSRVFHNSHLIRQIEQEKNYQINLDT